MKRKIYFRFALILSIIFAATSCSDITGKKATAEENANIPSGKGLLSLSVGKDSARTILPEEIDITTLEYKLVEKVTKTNGTYSEKIIANSLTCDANGKLSSASGYIFIDSGNNKNLKLYASKNGNNIFSAEKSIDVVSGTTTSVSFELQNLTSGNGDLSVTVNLPDNVDVARAEATLLTTTYRNIEGYDYEPLTVDETTKSVTYEKEGVAAGSYFVKFKFYRTGNTEIAPGYSETVIIKPNQKSSKTHSILLGKQYAINYINKVLKNGTYYDMPEAHVKKIVYPKNAKFTFTEHDAAITISLPESCIGYIFKGLYDDDTYKGDCTLVIPSGTTENISKYAVWEQIETNGSVELLPDTEISVTAKISITDYTNDEIIPLTDGKTLTIIVDNVYDTTLYINSKSINPVSSTSLPNSLKRVTYRISTDISVEGMGPGLSTGMYEILIISRKADCNDYYSKTYVLKVQ